MPTYTIKCVGHLGYQFIGCAVNYSTCSLMSSTKDKLYISKLTDIPYYKTLMQKAYWMLMILSLKYVIMEKF